jgi:hypothetical protein
LSPLVSQDNAAPQALIQETHARPPCSGPMKCGSWPRGVLIELKESKAVTCWRFFSVAAREQGCLPTPCPRHVPRCANGPRT